jgi:cyanophycin synthetase
VLALATYSDGEVLLYSLDPDAKAITDHRHRKGRAVLLRDDSIVLAQGASEKPLIDLAALPFSGHPTQPEQPDARPHVLAAVAAAWALGIPADLIRTTLLHSDQGTLSVLRPVTH